MPGFVQQAGAKVDVIDCYVGVLGWSVIRKASAVVSEHNVRRVANEEAQLRQVGHVFEVTAA